MPSEIAELERLFRDEALEIPALVECCNRRVYNSLAPAETPFPYAVFQVVPLDDDFGQARASIQSNFLIDFKIYARLPLPAVADEAVACLKEHFRSSETFQTDGYRISIRHERAINLLQPGARPDERIVCRGSTYRAWVS